MDDNKPLAPNDNSENEDEAVISMVEYMKENQELEEDAYAVLGDSDEKNCTYPLGYVGRQALYSCMTCPTVDKVTAGFCLACSYACHEGHDLHELYTKRNFRCDCGNKKFKGFTCKLFEEKDAYNANNKYNQNFDGLYCTCERPYPDHDDDTEDEMIQCIICEDWYHGRHLVNSVPVNGDYHEMVCGGCMDKHTFLWAYNTRSLETQTVKSETSSESVDVETPDRVASCSDTASDASKSTSRESAADSDKATGSTGSVPDMPSCSDNKLGEASTSTAQQSTSQSSDTAWVCRLNELQTREITVSVGATYWPEGFRRKLCTCDSCLAMYRAQDISFLPDEADTVLEYENRGQEKKGDVHQDPDALVLQGMGHVQQIEMLRGFHDMRSQLSDYLKHFAENGKVVREEDIKEFFEQMQARKRQRTDNIPSHFCR